MKNNQDARGVDIKNSRKFGTSQLILFARIQRSTGGSLSCYEDTEFFDAMIPPESNEGEI